MGKKRLALILSAAIIITMIPISEGDALGADKEDGKQAVVEEFCSDTTTDSKDELEINGDSETLYVYFLPKVYIRWDS